MQDPAVTYQYVLDTYPRGLHSHQTITNSCNRPWKAVTIDTYTNCMLCICDGWLPNPVGKITDFARLEDIWTNHTAQTIQQTVTDKKFTWCAVNHCGIANHNNYESVYQLIFGIDDSCNLQCPSCRREKRMHVDGPLFAQKLQAVEHTVQLLNNFDQRIHVTLACSGDPLASHIYRPLLWSYRGKPSQSFTLFTNGLLIKKQLENTALLPRITEFRISTDAGSKAVYEQVRLGGKWESLMENFDFLHAYRQSAGHNFAVNLPFVVQKNNFFDIDNFVDLCKKYNFRGSLTHLDDWGTWNRSPVADPDVWTINNGTYLEHNVSDPGHPDYQECRQRVQQARQCQLISVTPRLAQLLELDNGSN